MVMMRMMSRTLVTLCVLWMCLVDPLGGSGGGGGVNATVLSLEERESLEDFAAAQAFLHADIEEVITASAAAQCLQEAKQFCHHIRAKCRSECYEIEDAQRNEQRKREGVALLEEKEQQEQHERYVQPIMHDGAENSDHKPPVCPQNKCKKLHSHCRRVHEDACGLNGQNQQPAVKWTSLKTITAAAQSKRSQCIKELRKHCKRLRKRCEKDCTEDRAEAKRYLTPACSATLCREKYQECRESSTGSGKEIQEICNPELIVAKHVVGVACSIADANCVQPIQDTSQCLSPGCGGSATQTVRNIEQAL